jgi:hypothetical protein
VDDTTVYGFGRRPDYYRWRTPLEYHLFATPKQPKIVRDAPAAKARRTAAKKTQAAKSKAKASRPTGPRTQHPEYLWSRPVPIFVRALVLADDTLFIAGPPDVVDEEEAFRSPTAPAVVARLAEQDAALQGTAGAVLQAVDTEDGSTLAEYPLDSLPAFDGLIAAEQRLYLVTADGQVLCFSER